MYYNFRYKFYKEKRQGIRMEGNSKQECREELLLGSQGRTLRICRAGVRMETELLGRSQYEEMHEQSIHIRAQSIQSPEDRSNFVRSRSSKEVIVSKGGVVIAEVRKVSEENNS